MQTDLFSLSRRVAIVTGSARGLGRALENIMEGTVAEHARPETEERIRTRAVDGGYTSV